MYIQLSSSKFVFALICFVKSLDPPPPIIALLCPVASIINSFAPEPNELLIYVLMIYESMLDLNCFIKLGLSTIFKSLTLNIQSFSFIITTFLGSAKMKSLRSIPIFFSNL